MDLIACRHLWGVSEDFATCFPKFREAGFQQLETPIQWLQPAEEARLHAALTANSLDILPMCFTGGATVAEHVAEFRRLLTVAAAWKPTLVNFHSGADRWSLAERVAFYRECSAMARDVPFTVAHETHRGRCFYSPWTTLEVLDQVPDLWFCADFSHWCVVAERLLTGEEQVLARIFPRVRHIHARVGYAQGPQVPDPRAPEWADALAAHERWWDAIWREQAKAGLATTTMTPEFGPPDYMHTQPWTRQPVTDLWQICHWMAARQTQRFASGSWKT